MRGVDVPMSPVFILFYCDLLYFEINIVFIERFYCRFRCVFRVGYQPPLEGFFMNTGTMGYDIFTESLFLAPEKVEEPLNWAGHIPFAFWIVDMLRPEVLVELGTHSGNSYFAFCQSVKFGKLSTRCYAVDTWKGEEHAGYYGEEVLADVYAHNKKHYRTFSTLLRMTFDEALDQFDDNSIDLLHIDGRHTYDAVKNDFMSWLPKLSNRGVVLFHDIVVKNRNFGVWRFWGEVSACYPAMSFDHSHGLGVLFVGSDMNASIAGMLRVWQNPDGQHLIKSVVEKLARTLELELRVRRQDAELARLNLSFKKLSKEHKRVLQSSSWWLTRPFRKLVKSIRKRARMVRQRLWKRELTQQCTYEKWIDSYDRIDDKIRADIAASIECMRNPPLISVIMAAYNTPACFLEASIQSVQRQLYSHWELCIADDHSSDPEVRKIIRRYADKDSRIRYVFREKNGHISAASNSAMELASGSFLALLDHDDLLHPLALFLVAQEIIKNPDVRIIYSDEDKLSEQGKRFYPYFKSDFNYDLFLSHNLISHFGVYQTALVKELGGFRRGFEGSQDYDLALRVIEHIAVRQICHIPRVLYHWRVHRDSTSFHQNTKPYAHVAALRAVTEHVKRKGIRASVEPAPGVAGMIRVRYLIGDSEPSVDIVILTRDKSALLQKCVDSILLLTTYRNYSITIVDNGSSEPETMELFSVLERNERIRIYRDAIPFNFSRLNNRAVKSSTADYVCLMNNDIEILSPDWLSEMIGHAIQEEVGAVGARLWYPDKTLQHGGVIMGLGGVAGHAHKHIRGNMPGYFGRACLQQSFSAVTAACLLVARSKYEEVCGLDEVNLKIAFNDVDFCLKLQDAGYRNVWTPYAEMFHHESLSRGQDDTLEKQERFMMEVDYMTKRWPEIIASDPAYSPNLSLDVRAEPFSIAWPPRWYSQSKQKA